MTTAGSGNDDSSDDDGSNDGSVDDVVEIAIDGVLDLHHFSPKDLRTLIPDWLEACRDKEILAVRIIHGRGIGAVARSVHALLSRSPHVVAFQLADPGRGGRGATLADLAPPVAKR